MTDTFENDTISFMNESLSKSRMESINSMCPIALSIANNRMVYILLILEILMGVSASVPNCFLMCTIWRVSVFHKNLRLCLAHLSLCLFWFSFGYVIKSVVLFVKLISADPCRLITNVYVCKLNEIPLGIPAQVSVYAGLIVSIERLYSTMIYKRYDRISNKKPILAIGLIIFAYVIPIMNTINVLLAISPDTNRTLAICENILSSTPKSATQSIVINMIAIAFSICAAVVVWYTNERKMKGMIVNRAKHTLTARFQIEQNVQMNKIIIPSTLFQMLSYIPNYILFAFILVGLPLSEETKFILTHCNYLWKQCYALAHPIVCYARHKRIRREFQKCVFTSDCVKTLTASKKEVEKNKCKRNRNIEKFSKSSMETHFQMLTDAWNTAETSRRRYSLL